MGTVFISYSYKDKFFVDWLVERLTNENISVWYDKYEIALGDSILKKLKEGIESSSVMIIVLSESSSTSTWVLHEYNVAIYSAQMKGIRIIPILIGDVTFPRLSSFRYIDFSSDKELALIELIQNIHRFENEIIELLDWNDLDSQNFTNLVYDLLIKIGLRVKQHTELDFGFDFTASSQGIVPGSIVSRDKWLVETKLYTNFKFSINTIAKLSNAAKSLNADTILLVTNSLLTNVARDFIANNIKDLNVFVWDSTVLLDLLNKHEEIRNKYFEPLPIKEDASTNLPDLESIKVSNMISKLIECPEGREGWKEYENICIEILNYLFVPPLKEPTIQSRTESGLDVRDALYPNRGLSHNWKIIRDDFDAKSILIEFKNYSESEINKEVVNQARNYLKKSLIGRIAFICSKKKPNSSGIEARKQAYNEDTKLILFLNNEDLIEMLIKKQKGEDPSDLILDMIDDFSYKFG
jgi:hypothetical protein